MKKFLSVLFALTGWFAVTAQFALMIENRSAPVAETIIRFFSFFTILTNILVAVYFTLNTFNPAIVRKPGTLTAVTIYIFMAGAVYQVILRATWNPEGLQLIVDELLHTVIPVLAIIFWAVYEDKKAVTLRQIPKWVIYPLAYLAFILIRGSFSNFYPYPFVNVSEIGMTKTLLNSAVLVLVFFIISALFVITGKYFSKKQQEETASS
ncbi:Pr6Pr family membrane protein [Mucilaginibacter ginsenosidivorans]|uniref:Pr6Pr family membrane protein n=1 Tax=Mucilaginibacter ginsenosidivorans TaxID=398053 RepID=A0A5B8UW60_9SPHI|nr:Pr6Pr family membrane protein [Mucilaginibacter ginsenosidivorans]QEC63138.1 hypothetical protein FRZ54_11305 [Mucilaginibacter ginsenosidivorans]